MSTETKSNGVPSILQKIYAQRQLDVEKAKSTPGTTPSDLDTLLSLHLAPPLISVVDRLKSGPKPGLMAEIKRASPSKGDIALTANAARQALTYALGGASVISVLTEPTWFKGSLLDMRLARDAVGALPNRPAILRKEFIFDEYQIAEARLHGADTVLLIVAMLPVPRLQALYAYSVSLGMEPLVEVNNAAEMHSALALGAKIVGVNNRNLHDFNVDMGTTSRLADMVAGRDVVLCALSGISSAADVERYTAEGVGAVLVGESLMRAKDAGAFIRELLGLPGTREAATLKPRAPLGKVDGVRTAEEALRLAAEGA
ncbi:indole-3-glycerol phosphate synthase, partial [Gloeophyllum trabeum ATCC 11539]